MTPSFILIQRFSSLFKKIFFFALANPDSLYEDVMGYIDTEIQFFYKKNAYIMA